LGGGCWSNFRIRQGVPYIDYLCLMHWFGMTETHDSDDDTLNSAQRQDCEIRRVWGRDLDEVSVKHRPNYFDILSHLGMTITNVTDQRTFFA